MTAYGIPHTELRDTFGLGRLKTLDLSTEEEQDIAFEFWHIEIAERIVDDDIESAWYCIEAAAVGDKVFSGPDRLCRGHLENLPIGLVCSPTGILGLVNVLYSEMSKRGCFPHPLDPSKVYKPWRVRADDGKVFEILPRGQRVARILFRQHNVHACIAALEAYAIAEWAYNPRQRPPLHA